MFGGSKAPATHAAPPRVAAPPPVPSHSAAPPARQDVGGGGGMLSGLGSTIAQVSAAIGGRTPRAG